MKHIKIFYLLFLVILFQNSNAQYSQPSEVISSGGGESSNSTYTNIGVLGETFYLDCSQGGTYKTSMGFFNDLICGIYTEIDEIEINKNSINIFPNPVTNNLFIEIQNQQDANIIIFNTLGQKIFTSNALKSNKTINISNLRKGFYFVVIRDLKGDILLAEKIIKE